MKKIICPICKAKNKMEICRRCNANLQEPISEYRLLFSRANTTIDENRPVKCKVAITNQRIVLYKIKAESFNQTFPMYIRNRFKIKQMKPYLAIPLEDIEQVKRYGFRHFIYTKTGMYFIDVSKFKEFDAFFTPYKQCSER